jgi:hypothetical protein
VVAGDGFVVTVGQTYMDDLPATAEALDTTCGTDGVCDGIGPLLVPRPDGFVAVYGADLQDTLAFTYLGGSDAESARSVALTAGGDIIVVGETSSADFPVTGEGADGRIASYRWFQILGPPVELAGADTAIACFRAPFVRFAGRQVGLFLLVVVDDRGAAAADLVWVDVSWSP